MKKVPVISNQIKKEKKQISDNFSKDVEHRVKGVPYVTRLPADGWSDEDLMQTMEKYLALGNIFITSFGY